MSFLEYTNQNKPITIKLNGEAQKEVFFEYNTLGYPSKVTNWHGALIYELECILL